MWWAPFAHAWELRGAGGAPSGRDVPGEDVFAPAPLPAAPWSGSADLGEVAAASASELLEQVARGSALGSDALPAEVGVDVERVLTTLWRVAITAREDVGAAAPRLEDPAWVAANFESFAWTPDVVGAKARKIAVDDRIRLTSYAVFEADGAPARDDAHDTALWALPDDEADGVPGFRTHFTRMDVYAGAYLPGGAAAGHAQPLVWLSRADANEALMQGSVVVRSADGARRTFNVFQNNGIAWNPKVKDPNRQARFWYFREVQGLLGVEGIPLRAKVAVAGDVNDLGLGPLVALTWDDGGEARMQLAVVADTGGAFEPNLFQLDWFAGTFRDRAAYGVWADTAPTRARAWLLAARTAR